MNTNDRSMYRVLFWRSSPWLRPAVLCNEKWSALVRRARQQPLKWRTFIQGNFPIYANKPECPKEPTAPDDKSKTEIMKEDEHGKESNIK